MAGSKVAVVTGGNKGIGLAIVRAMCKQFTGDVYLTARDPKLGEESVKKLQEEEGLASLFHQLDITDMKSIGALRDFMKEKYGGIDILINNAGIAFKGADPTPFNIQAEVTLKTNYFATRDICNELLPLIKPHGRVVNVSSMVSQSALANCSKDLQEKFRSNTITEEELSALMEKFVEDTKKGIHSQEGWPNTAYGVSKIGVTVLSRIQDRKLNAERPADGILLNACCPGWVRTDMITLSNQKKHTTILRMSSSVRVAVVTGGNKGIGLAITRALCKQFKGDVYLTARNPKLGEEAVAKLKQEGLTALFHQLDICDLASIRALRDFMKEKYGGIDVLVNNAGIAFKEADPTPFEVQAEVTLKTNYFATRDVCNELLPLIKPHGRVVNISSKVSLMALASCSPALQATFRSDTITEEELSKLMAKFVEDTKKGIHQKEGWPNTGYGVSKIGVTVLSLIQAREIEKTKKGQGILLNPCCPGFVQTDMGGSSQPKTPDEGAETPVYLALLPPAATCPHGQFVSEKAVKQW